jgi:DNA polymerase-3 subunit alpha
MAALLTVERANSDKVAEYIRDARVMGIEVLPPDINRSSFVFSVVGQNILFGLSAVKNVGEGAAGKILQERDKGGKFKSLADFLKRADASVANKRVVESLIKSGAFDAFSDRAAMLEGLDGLLRWSQAERESATTGMMGLFGDESHEPQLPRVKPLDEITRLRFEKEALGIYVTGHPLLRYEGMREAASCTVDTLGETFFEQKGARGRARLLLAGLVEGIARKPTKSGGMMCRFTLSDETGALEVVAFGRSYDKVSPRIAQDAPVLVVVEVEPELEGEGLRVMAQEVFPYADLEGLSKVVELELDLALVDEKKLLELRSIMDDLVGTLPIQIRVRGPGGWAMVEAREIKVSEEAPKALREMAWLEARLVPDRDKLLYAGQPNGENRFRKDPPNDPVVPF